MFAIDVGAGEREVGGRRSRLPDVLADGRADERLPAAQEDELAAGLEVAVLVEDPVVGQELLVVDGLDLAVDAHGAGVEEVAVEVRRANERRDPLGLGCDLLEGLGGGAEEPWAEEQILGRIPGDRELGEEDELGARVAGLGEPLEDARAVALEVTDDRVHLCESEAHSSMVAVSA